jgi:hypothetical protein
VEPADDGVVAIAGKGTVSPTTALLAEVLGVNAFDGKSTRDGKPQRGAVGLPAHGGVGSRGGVPLGPGPRAEVDPGFDDRRLRRKFFEGVRRYVASEIWQQAREVWYPKIKRQEDLCHILGFESQAAVSLGIHEGMLSLESLIAMLVRSNKGWTELPAIPDVETRNRVGFIFVCEAMGQPILEHHYEYLRSINARLSEWNLARARRVGGREADSLARLVPVVVAEAGAALEARARIASQDKARARNSDVVLHLDDLEKRCLSALARVHKAMLSLHNSGPALTQELLDVHARYGLLWRKVFGVVVPASV